MLVLLSHPSTGEIAEDSDRPALRVLLLPFEADCNRIVGGDRIAGLRNDMEYTLSTVKGVSAHSISAAAAKNLSANSTDDLVAEFDANTLVKASIACSGDGPAAFEILAARIAAGGADAEISGEIDGDVLALRDAIQASAIELLMPGNDPGREVVDRQGFVLYLDAIDQAGELSYPERLDLVRAATDQDDNFALAWMQRGLFALKAGERGGPDAACQFVESDKAYRKALELNPALPLAVHGLASVQMRTGQTEAASAILRAGLVGRPDFALLHAKLGYVNRYAGLMSESIDEYRRSQALDRSYESLIEGERQIVKSHIYSGEYERAFTSYDRILQWLRLMDREPDEKMLFYQGVARFYADQKDIAVEFFDASIATSPGTVWSDFAAAYRAAAVGNTGELLRLADELSTGNVTDGERRYRLTHLYAMGGKPEKALFHLKGSAKSGFFNYPYTKSDRFLASIADSSEFKSILQFIYNRHANYAQSASDQSKLRNTYEEAIHHALGFDYDYVPDHGTCTR